MAASGLVQMIAGSWRDDHGRVLEISRAADGSFRVTARPGEGRAAFPPSNLLSEDTVEARDLPGEVCDPAYPLPTDSPAIRIETGDPGYGRTLCLTLVVLLRDGEPPAYRAPTFDEARSRLRLIPQIGSSYLDAVAYHHTEAVYERLPWAEPLGPYRPSPTPDALRREIGDWCQHQASVLAERWATVTVAEVLPALYRHHGALVACGPIAALRLFGSKVDSYSYGVVQARTSAWLAAPSPEAAEQLAADVGQVCARMADPEARAAVDATVRCIRELDLTAGLDACEGFAQAFTRCRFIPVLSADQGRRLLAWRALDEALSWAYGRECRVARPRGFSPDRYFDERRDESNWWNNDVEHFIVDRWTGEPVLVFHGNERNSSDTYEGCRGVGIDVEQRCVMVRKYAGEEDEIVPLPDEAQA